MDMCLSGANIMSQNYIYALQPYKNIKSLLKDAIVRCSWCLSQWYYGMFGLFFLNLFGEQELAEFENC